MGSAKRSAIWAGIIFLLGILPLLISTLCAAFANRLNCALGADARPCLVAGADVSGVLRGGFNLAWLSNITIWLVPMAIALAMVAALRFFRARGGAQDPGI